MSLLKLSKPRQLKDWCVLWPELAELLINQPLAATHFYRLVHDSRLVEEGDVFFALTGTQQKGLSFVEQAWQQGALLAVTEGELALEKHPQGWLLKLPDLAKKLGSLLALTTQAPLQTIKTQAITGTNGKSSVAHYLCQVWQQLGKRCALVGTLGTGELNQLETATHTTPDLFQLHQLYADWAAKGIQQVALEASSHALDQGRLAGLFMTSAVFTNLSRDHLDYHGSLEAYASAKQQLFLRPELEVAVLNLDDALGRQWLANLQDQAYSPKQLIGYSLKPTLASPSNLTSIQVLEASYTLAGIKAKLIYQQETWDLSLPLLGAFNLANGLAVMAAMLAEGVAMPALLKAMQALKPVPGRMQPIKLSVNNGLALPQVVVDYAHTPDALEQALLALRQHCDGKLWCLVGCGGNRDAGKRYLMGEVAKRLADKVVVTDDNPRNEDPAAIRQAILSKAGAAAIEVAGRHEAIQQVINQAATNDWILIAGKGHETWQEIAGVRLDFNDAEEAMTALQLRAATPTEAVASLSLQP
ncbi:UDP-N-acetylmuramoyl-L-alanyl-D-glutamate--2,6-diaminopimelate ligase [Marinospirillum insulare]|uniref:UDP-N-acetylmuramoyl-L-alanyl-D-glutamate--2,6-diaminopimelate ligase n=1 Tax=Marinospirillum insulare TaxID=217169 RepID=A0ABQ5ZZ39_9GAMM|nr:UDP-N-acetylmuramoyl-L-alanyl-D-glutamate--2,6-diaminopimelate ligase [Marinospirillum insulare]GLR63149.1 UDP-N-acetylmuramoyl-L-alanyl-D-glutamate--2,6-diaminopimelate ligase [Marinospirillum insulare]